MKARSDLWMTVAATAVVIGTVLAEPQLAQSKKCVSSYDSKQRRPPHVYLESVLTAPAVPRARSKFCTTQQGLVPQLDSV